MWFNSVLQKLPFCSDLPDLSHLIETSKILATSKASQKNNDNIPQKQKYRLNVKITELLFPEIEG